MNTPATKVSELEHNWQLVDVKGKILGRVASEIAQKLIGKSKRNYVRNLDCGDNVVVINAAHFEVTGKKDKEKLYDSFSGYPGGLKQKALWQVKKEKPTEPIRHAVWGMLPKNKLRDRLITRLYIYPTAEHPYTDKFSK
jgi:large subunit ribosomal protein L13